MFYRDFKGLKLSALGFGTMRLPLKEDKKTIDEELASRMVGYAIASGVNYFDTAWPYHDGKSERVIGEILSKYPRESWYLATKYPGHQHMAKFDPADTFKKQLEKCKVDYFDFYLLHNICENSLDDYLDPKWSMLDYFVEQKRLGRIKHLGFSTHAGVDTLKSILDGPYGPHMEFCQIQLNYLDWTLQDAKSKIELLAEYGVPVWVMEPVRGGYLADLGEQGNAALKALEPGSSVASWAFRWLQSVPGVVVTLSGMSDMSQVMDNISTFESERPLSKAETALLGDIAASLHQAAPCTACRYCCAGCPCELDIPTLVKSYNDLSLQFSFAPMMMLESLPEDKRPSACLGCGACQSACPQGIEIPEIMQKLSALYDKYPKWSDICRERNALLANEK